jgi:hypothetical protein
MGDLMKIVVLTAFLAAMMAAAPRTVAQETPAPALPPGKYVLTLTLEVAPPGLDVDEDVATLKAELSVKNETISITATDEDGESRVLAGTMSKGRISFEVREEDPPMVATMKCEGEVKSSREAAGTFVVTIGDQKGSGKWNMKAEEKK